MTLSNSNRPRARKVIGFALRLSMLGLFAVQANALTIATTIAYDQPVLADSALSGSVQMRTVIRSGDVFVITPLCSLTVQALSPGQTSVPGDPCRPANPALAVALMLRFEGAIDPQPLPPRTFDAPLDLGVGGASATDQALIPVFAFAPGAVSVEIRPA